MEIEWIDCNEFLNDFFKKIDTSTNIKKNIREDVCNQISMVVDIYDYFLSKKQILLLNSMMIEICRLHEKGGLKQVFFQECASIASFIITCGEANIKFSKGNK